MAEHKRWLVLILVLVLLVLPGVTTRQVLESSVPRLERGALLRWHEAARRPTSLLIDGRRAERSGDFVRARDTYLQVLDSLAVPLYWNFVTGAAANASAGRASEELRRTALGHLRRINRKLSRTDWSFVADAHRATTPLLLLTLLVAGALVTAWLFVTGIRMIPRRSGFAIGSFVIRWRDEAEDADAPAHEPEFQQALADSLSWIQLINNQADRDLVFLNQPISAPAFTVPGRDGDHLPGAIAEVVELTTAVGGKLSLRNVSRIGSLLRERRRYLISGSVTWTSGEWRVLARMKEIRTGRIVNEWELSESDIPRLSRPSDTDGLDSDPVRDASLTIPNPLPPKGGRALAPECFALLARALAYRILYDQPRSRRPDWEIRSWQALRYYTEGLHHMRRYAAARPDSPERIAAIRRLRIIVDELDQSQRRARFNLGRLYLDRGDHRAAIREFERLASEWEAEPTLSTQEVLRLIRDAHTNSRGPAAIRYIVRRHRTELDEARLLYDGGSLREEESIPAMLQEVRELENLATRTDVEQLRLRGAKRFLEGLQTSKQLSGLMDGLQSPDAGVRDEAHRMLEQVMDTKWMDEADRLVSLHLRLGPRLIGRDIEYEEALLDDLSALAERVPLDTAGRLLKLAANATRAREWRKLKNFLEALRELVAQGDRDGSDAAILAILENVRLPWGVRLSGVPAALQDVLNWVSRRHDLFYLHTRYFMAHARLLSLNEKQFLLARHELKSIQDVLARSHPRSGRENRLAQLSLCLEIQAVALLELVTAARYGSADPFRPRDGDKPRSARPESKRSVAARAMAEAWIEGARLGKHMERIADSQIPEVVALTRSTDRTVRAVALETLGLWARWNCGTTHASNAEWLGYFEAALAAQPSSTTMSFLAEALHRLDREEATRLVKLALLRSPANPLARQLFRLLQSPKETKGSDALDSAEPVTAGIP